MMRPVEGLVFLALATGLHMGVWNLAPAKSGLTSAGASGADAVTVAAASPAQAAMVARWQQAPVVSLKAPAFAAPLPAALPAPAITAGPGLRPSLPLAPDQSAAPQLALADEAPEMDQSTPPPHRADVPPPVRPRARPDAPIRTAEAAPQQAQPERRAEGRARMSQNGTTGADQAQAAAARQRLALRAEWGARIHSKVQRNLRYPRGVASSGTAKLALKVAPNGTLQGLSLLRSSGDALLDKAAISAVQRAGRFDRAPAGLTEVSYAFSLSLTFSH